MSKKKPKSQQSSNATVGNGDSSDSNEVNDKTSAPAQNSCCHYAKAVDFNQVVKGLKNYDDLKKNYCQICVKESTPLQGNSIFVCLKCGTKTCCREHSNAHSSVARSDPHYLAYDYSSQLLWCHECSSKMNERDIKNKKISTCVSSLKRQMLNFTAKEKINPQNTKTANPQTQSEDASPRNEVVKNGKKGKSVNVSQSTSVPVRGLSNLGNTCYFNSVMQCLARTEPLLAELKETDHPTEIRLELKGGDTLEGCLRKWDEMTACLHETLTTLLSSGSAYVPSKFLNMVRKKHPQFEGFDQHDAHELLRHTLDSIRIADLKRYRRLMLAKKNVSTSAKQNDVPPETQKELKELEHKVTQAQTFVPEHTFKGKLVSRVECQDCHHSSEYIEGFLDLSLPILADKPHPPTARRKTGAVSATPEPSSENYVHMSAKAKRQQKRLARQVQKNEKRQKDPGANGDEEVGQEAIEVQEALADKQEEMLNMEEEKPHESGYSSEKASSSLRGSPSSEEVRSSSPCDDSWSAVPQHNESWLSALPAGVQLPLQQHPEPSPTIRRPTNIPLDSDGTPDLACLSLYDSVGSTLNPLCQNTDSLMAQEPFWRERIHRWYFRSLPVSKETNDAQAKSVETEPPPTASDQNADTSVVQEPSTVAQAVVTPLRDSSPRKFEPKSDDRVPVVSVVDGRECSGDIGRAATPPLRKARTTHVKRETDISPVREEESDSLPEPLSSVEEISPIKPLFLKSETTAPIPVEGSLDYADPHGPIVMALDTICEECFRESKEKLEQTHSESLFFGSSFSDPDLSISLRQDDPSEQQDDNPADWSTFRNTFNCPKNAAPSLRRESGSEGKQSAPNNSLDSEGNESGNEKCMIAYVHEIAELPNEQVEEIPLNSGMISQEDSPSNEKPDHAVVEDKEEVTNQKLPSSEEGDFEPLLSTVPNNPKVSFETPEIKIWDNDMDEFFKERFAECNSLKKKDNQDPSECSVESCLRQFTAIELMNGSNKVGCSVCTDRQNKGNKDGKTVLTMATKQLLIGQAPPVLILHLKRFQVQLRSFRKLTKHVSFPLILDISPFCSPIGEDKNKFNNEEPKLYSLYGIVEHRGTLNSGHYVAYVKVEEADKRRWFCISDSHVDEVTEERVLKVEAYLLFYSKITLPFS